LIFRRFEDSDLRSLLSLLRSSFDGYPSLELWDWKYTRNPNGSPLIWVAEDKGKIVGSYILNLVKLRIGQSLVMGAQSVDAAVDNAYRGGGIFKKLAANAIAQATKEGIELIYAFPNEISYRGQVRLGYHPMFIIPKMHRIFRIGSLFEGRLNREGSLYKKAVGIVDSFQRGRKKNIVESDYMVQIRLIKEFDSRFEVFWKEIIKANNYVLVERDLGYLKWRYMKNPEKHYTTYVCEKDERIVGYIVLSVEKILSIDGKTSFRRSVGNIIDLFTLPDMNDVACPLISAACHHFEHEQVDIAECWMGRWHPFYPMLTKFGFSDYYELLRRTASHSKISSYLIYYVNSQTAFNKAIKSIQSPNKSCWWYIMQGDSDFK
jgi:predicted N-acetyltransferase YhbS